MKEEKVFFKNSKGEKIAGIFVSPDVKNPPLVVIVHGFGGYTFEELFSKIAYPLVDEGFAIFSFMFPGYGPSEGKFSDITVENEVETLKDVYNFVKTLDIDKERIGSISQSLGCYATLLSKLPFKCNVLISPATDLKTAFTREFGGYGILEELEKGNDVKLDWGRIIYSKFWENVKNHGFFQDFDKVQQPTFVIYGDKDWATTLPEIKKIYNLLPEPKKLEILEGAEHVFLTEDKYAKRVVPLINDWFNRWLK
ncbi:MAG: prolyl oligopeptidase family serine peptidase [archaeon]|nr:MAG: prolyl oligopeptidase family serine peptidase [archaeon]